MNFPFTFEMTVAGAVIAQIEGTLVLEADPDSRTPCGRHPDWTVAHVMVDGVVRDGSTVRSVEVMLPDSHKLHDGILAGALGRHRHEIDAQWLQRCSGFDAEARDRARDLQHSAAALA